MAEAPTGLGRGFLPAIEYMRNRQVNLPTAKWNDLWQGQHARAFVVAGVMREDMLADFRAAIDRAIAQGTSYDTFRKDFDAIVARYGWAHTGTAAWRSRVIWQTNVRTAFMAGRYAQMTDPAVLEQMPYWIYDHTTILNAREEHKVWDGLVLRHDDPWWQTHYPPNGWGCNCRVRPLSERQLRKLGKTKPDAAPPAGGVPAEWQYNVGEAAWGRPLADMALRKLQDANWTAVPGRTFREEGRPEQLPADKPRAEPRPMEDTSPAGIRAAWKAQYGEQAVLLDPSGARVMLSDAIVEHWLEKPGTRLAGRERYLPLLREVIEDPAEIWVSWAVNGNGRYALRRYYLKRFDLADGKTLTLIAEASGGIWTTFNFMVGRTAQAKNREGLLVYGRPPE
jgi:hypothetical protein